MKSNKQSLYRIYRPKDFLNVAGHKNVIEILKNQIKDDKISHALLFAGQRGTGKTSVARIFAKTINCLQLQDFNACDKCSNCILANDSKSSDIVEIDAASNNGVDEIREIKNSVLTMPLNSKYKVYIIDEVHMLTKQAFNALLKTLEEPPVHTVFILATTEFAKIPQTILSRCQIFNFTKIDKHSLIQRLSYICREEEFEIDQEVLNEIYYLSDGALRDAINILEQLMLISDKQITINNLKSIFLIATKKEQLQIVKQTLDDNPEFIISYFEKANDQAMNWDVFALGIIEIIKEIVEYKLTNKTNFLSVLGIDDVRLFDDQKLEKIFVLADNLADAYSKTRNSNISYNYLLLSLLKSINRTVNNTSTSLSDNSIQNSHQNLTENLVAEFKEIEKNANKKQPHIEQKNVTITQDSQPSNRTKFIKPKIEIVQDSKDDLCLTITDLKDKLDNRLWDFLSTQSTLLIDNIDLINFLVATKEFKEEKNKIDYLFDELFSTSENELLINSTQANNLYMLLNTKIMTVTDSVIILKTPTKAQANLINQLMLDEQLLNFIKIWFKKPYFIFAIDDIKKKELFTIFSDLKSKNKLPQYNKITFEQIKSKYFSNQSTTDQKTEDLISKAKVLFGDDDFIIGD
ncbi:DNA polymerase III subunit gamma/tau [Mycoplasma putrefaciens]|uniref:DNA polymerase III subunit gamma/tau n=1 Tax=Mycoplasma putrefaciens TaxID=2123 RepID=UPI003DA5EFEF